MQPLTLTQATSWQPGMVVGRYRLTRAVARGGMGEIWLAEQTQGAQPVIIKRLHDQAAQQDSRGQMLLDEARIAAQLSHPNIVRLLDLGSGQGVVFVVMEYLHGEPLARVQTALEERKEPMPAALAVSIVAQIARALAYAHARTGVDGQPLKLVHRDVTPDNIILTYDGVPKLIDFGIAKAAGRSTVTRDGVVKGKLAYMAPEQARTEAIDGRADQFSLGVILFELLSGTRFHDPSLDDLGLFRTVTLGGPFPRLVDRAPKVHGALLRAVERATAMKPEDRFPDASRFAAALEAWLKNEARPDLAGWLAPMFRAEDTSARSSIQVAELDAEAMESAAWFANLPALDRDGRVVKPSAPGEDPDPNAPFDPFGPNDKPLELARPARQAAPEIAMYQGPAPRRSGGGAGALIVVALLLAALGGAYFTARSWLPRLRRLTQERAALVITSEPSGATVRIAGQEVGTTPFASDNTWTGRTPITITLPGYEPYKDSFTGGSDVQLFARMKRR